MTENSRNFAVGLVSIIALVGFAALLMLFGELENLTTRRYELILNMNSAAGLRAGSAIELDGIPVGRVGEMTRQQLPEYPVRVIGQIDRGTLIPATVQGTVDTQLIAGSSVLQLTTGPHSPGQTPDHLPTDGTAELFVEYRPWLEQITAELDSRTEPFKRAVESFEQLSRTYVEVGENLNALLAPQDAQALAEGEAPNLHSVVMNFDEAVQDTRNTLKLAQNWLGDEQLRQEVRDAVVNANRLIEDAAAMLAQVSEMTVGLEDRAGDLIDRLIPVADELAVILEETRRITRAASEGDGTIAQLLNNPDLYNNLDDAAIRLERALREMQLFIQKVSAEGLPVRWF